MRVINIASGSKGNCTLIETQNNAILIDCGLSVDDIEERLMLAGCNLEKVTAIFVSHIHADHIKSVERFSKKYNVLVYATERNWNTQKLLKVPINLQKVIVADDVIFNDLLIRTFPVDHDAPSTVGFKITEKGGKSVAIVTDLGIIGEDVIYEIAGCDLIMIESNHDIQMLKDGPYPYILKQRILSSSGHLSNIDASNAIVKLAKLGTKYFMLMHISETNNTPELAYATVHSVLKSNNLDNIFVGVAFQDKLSTNFLLKTNIGDK